MSTILLQKKAITNKKEFREIQNKFVNMTNKEEFNNFKRK